MKKIPILLFSFLLSACINEFNFKQETASDMLVVEGYLTDQIGESKITISKSIPFDDADQSNYVNDAVVTVIENDQTTHEFVMQKNSYIPKDSQFKAKSDNDYKLRIKHNNETYESQWVSMERASDIEEITWTTKEVYKAGLGSYKQLNTNVTTNEDGNTSRFYRYLFEETWLNVAGTSLNQEYETHFIYSDEGEPLDLNYKKISYDNITYCWPSTSPNGIYIASSLGLTINKLSNVPIFELNLNANGRKLLHKYSLLIKQFSIPEDVYHTYSTMKQFSEDDATLFASQPGFVEGNIQCTSNQNKPILGVFHVSELKRERIFISYFDLNSEDRRIVSEFSKNCTTANINLDFGYCQGDEEIKAIRDSMKLGYEIINVYKDTDYNYFSFTLSQKECMDCRTEGTNIKPDWWGNITE